ncbi:hypothetical protein EMN47_16695 [Prolixibacteraceae bacterium JC049]|nr:hypothetical protein [Prolixibacteraceae bacterium JC049]
MLKLQYNSLFYMVMDHVSEIQVINYGLKNIALYRFMCDEEFASVISPFSRIYLITEGKGWLLIDGKKIILEPGNLYFPKYS